MVDPKRAEASLADYRKNPEDFGLCVRAIWMLNAAGGRAEAQGVARSYAQLHEASDRGGDTLMSFVLDAPMRRFASGEQMIAEGVDGDLVYVLLAGEARVRRMGVGELATLHAGAVLGEVAPLTGTARTASVYALRAVGALEFPPSVLAALSRHLPEVYRRLRETGRSRMVKQLMGPDSIFAPLAEDARNALFDQCLPCTLPEGTRIIREGHQGTAVCIIASGMAEVWRRAKAGKRKILAELGPGEVFGELAFLFDRVASATVESKTPLTIFALDRPRFDAALTTFPDAKERVVDLAKHRVNRHPHTTETELPVVRIIRS